MKATYDDTILMDRLLLAAREELAEAEEIQAGRKARLTLTNDIGEQRSYVRPFRVIAYARKAMGAPAVVAEGSLRAVFASKGITVSLTPTTEGYLAISDVLIARLCGEKRRVIRAIAKNKAIIKRNEAQIKKGGAAL